MRIATVGHLTLTDCEVEESNMATITLYDNDFPGKLSDILSMGR
jgi:hypothetical protein